MAVSMFTRFSNVRNVLNINNFSAVGSALNITQNSNIIFRPYSNSIKTEYDPFGDDIEAESTRKLSKAMRIYLQKAKEFQKLLEKETHQYNIGKRHLANMMGEDPDKFTENDVNRAIKYLLPSGLHDWRAHPMMYHPSKIFGKKKEAKFDETGRPYHYLFYTLKPNYYTILHSIAASLQHLNHLEDQKLENKELPSPGDKLDLSDSNWLTRGELQSKIMEDLKSAEYEYFIKSITRVADHPMSKQKADFIMKYRKILKSGSDDIKLPSLKEDSDGRPFVVAEHCVRKSARGKVKVIGNGSGKITINGQDIMYFPNVQFREQIIFPLIFTNMSDKVDIEATVSGGGPSGQSGAIRWGIAWGLRNFVDKDMFERMRVAGLLTKDWRKRERKKWGQEGARRKFTWKKR